MIDGETKLPELRPRGSEELTLAAGESRRVEFRLRGLETGVHHGVVRLSGVDGLDADNLRYFAIEVKEAWPLLVVAPENDRPVRVRTNGPGAILLHGRPAIESRKSRPGQLHGGLSA